MSEQGENIRLTGNDRDDSGGYGAAFHHWRLLAGKKCVSHFMHVLHLKPTLLEAGLAVIANC